MQIAVETTGGEPAQLMNMIFGNCSLWETCGWSASIFRRELLARVPRPAARDRRNPRVARRRGTRADEHGHEAAGHAGRGARADVPESSRSAGVDIIKDDHGIADQIVLAVRSSASTRAKRRRAAKSPRRDARSFYAPNLTGTPRLLRERAQIARNAGMRVVLVAPMLVGIPAFVELVEDFPGFVYLAHPGRRRGPHRAGAAVRAPVSAVRRRRVDLHQLRRPVRATRPRSAGRWPRRPPAVGICAPALPVPAGGMRLERVDELLDFYGPDTMLLIGGNLLVARDALLERRASTSTKSPQPTPPCSRRTSGAAPVWGGRRRERR